VSGRVITYSRAASSKWPYVFGTDFSFEWSSHDLSKGSRAMQSEDSEKSVGPARLPPGIRRIHATRSAREPRHTRRRSGTAPDGTEIELHTLSAGGGLAAEILTYGGIVHRLWVPGRDGEPANVALGLPRPADYVESNGPYFGAIDGRYANRIASAAFTLDGVTYRLPPNDGSSCLHGGLRGFDKRVWRAVKSRSAHDSVGLVLRYTSPDGEEGFPGALAVEVAYTVSRDDALRIDYRATTNRATVVNLTSHVYWNLSGEGSGSVDDHRLLVAASRYLPVDAAIVPTGEVAPVRGTPLDFTRLTPIGSRVREPSDQLVAAHGFDHHFVLDRPNGPRAARAAVLHDPASGRLLEITTTEPGIQVYSGNHLQGSLAGTSGRLYRQGDGLALETQHCPDSPNQPRFPSTVLRPGQVFRSTTIYRFSVD
jgi:aldose 1-epimerase